MRALLLCAAAAGAAITNERLVDPVAKEMALADEKRYRENYAPRTPKELAEDERHHRVGVVLLRRPRVGR